MYKQHSLHNCFEHYTVVWWLCMKSHRCLQILPGRNRIAPFQYCPIGKQRFQHRMLRHMYRQQCSWIYLEEKKMIFYKSAKRINCFVVLTNRIDPVRILHHKRKCHCHSLNSPGNPLCLCIRAPVHKLYHYQHNWGHICTRICPPSHHTSTTHECHRCFPVKKMYIFHECLFLSLFSRPNWYFWILELNGISNRSYFNWPLNKRVLVRCTRSHCPQILDCKHNDCEARFPPTRSLHLGCSCFQRRRELKFISFLFNNRWKCVDWMRLTLFRWNTFWLLDEITALSV